MEAARPHFEACNARAGARGDRGSKPDRQAPSSPIFSGAQSSQARRSAAGPWASLPSGCHEQVTGSQGRGGGRGRRRLGRGEGGAGGLGWARAAGRGMGMGMGMGMGTGTGMGMGMGITVGGRRRS